MSCRFYSFLSLSLLATAIGFSTLYLYFRLKDNDYKDYEWLYVDLGITAVAFTESLLFACLAFRSEIKETFPSVDLEKSAANKKYYNPIAP